MRGALVLLPLAACQFPPLPPFIDAGGGDSSVDGQELDADEDAPSSCSGLRIVFDDGRPPGNEVFIVSVDGAGGGGGVTPLAPSSSADYGVTGSPRGFVAFTSDRDGNPEVYRIAIDGSGLLNLTSDGAADGNPRFSADGSMIAYARSGALWVMTADGSNRHPVTAGNSSSPRWSPDGSKLAFEIVGAEADLWIVNVDGTGLRQLTALTGSETSATWSPDGARLAFAGSGDIHVINADGTGRVNLTSDAAVQADPSWSPDGSLIAFADAGVINTMSPAGGARTPISTPSGYADQRPQWSPDGTKIFWTRTSETVTNIRIGVVANGDGSLPAAITGPTNFVGSMDWVACP